MKRALLAGVLCLAGCKRAPAPEPAPLPLTHEIYIWQRAWNPGVTAAAQTAAPVAHGLLPLAAQLAWRDGKPSVTWPDIPWQTLAKPDTRLSVALRVDPVAAAHINEPATKATVVETARECLRRARNAGATPAELHLDFDAAESQLRTYAGWVRAVRQAVVPLPVTFTALPTWLTRPDFPDLAMAGNGYVLQVHGCERPTPGSTRLCDAAKARAWVRTAARVAPGVPFRVALPTYAYETAFTADGSCLGMVAEGPQKLWPPGSRVIHLSADPTELATLRDEWQRDRPGAMTGLVWFRLPVPDDERNWRWPTLLAMLENRHPRAAPAIRQTPSENGRLLDLAVENGGDADQPMRGQKIVVKWSGACCEAGEALAGFSVEIRQDHAIFRPATGDGIASRATLRAGESITLGWLRFSVPVATPEFEISPDDTPPL